MGMNPFDKQTTTYAFPGITLSGIPTGNAGMAAKMSDEKREFLIQLEPEG